MVEHIAMRIINRVKSEISAFIDESGDHEAKPHSSDTRGQIIPEIRDHLGKLIAEDHLINKQISANEEALAKLQDKVEFAISQDRDDLARAALIQRKGLERQLAGFEARLKEIELESLELEALIQELSQEAAAEDAGSTASETSTGLSAQLKELEALVKQKTDPSGNTPGEGS